MTDDTRNTLKNSTTPKALLAAAATTAHGQDAADHAELLGFLQSAEFLLRLDPPADAAKGLRVGRVLRELSGNAAPSASGVLVALTQSKTFLSDGRRVDLLISACTPIRPAPPPVIRFWDDHCQPDDGYMHLTIDAVVANGTDPAMSLLEAKLLDARIDADDKVAWMHSAILTNRDDAPLLRMCERAIPRLPADLRTRLVETLFDYRPAEWYAPAAVYSPPDRARAAPESRAVLRRIGEMAIGSVAMDAQLRAAVDREVAAAAADNDRGQGRP